MEATSRRWRQITPSQFQWEAEALDWVRSRLSDNDPIQAWANFEFVSGGAVSEVDLLVTTRKGFFLIEIKSHPGRITGSHGLWTWHRPDGSRSTFDNPIYLADTKAKRLKSLLERHWTRDDQKKLGRLPFVKALVFLSSPEVEVDLSPDLAQHVCVRDRDPDPADPTRSKPPVRSPHFKGLFDVISRLGNAEAANPNYRQLGTPVADAIVRAMDKVDIKESTRSRRVGSYLLELPAFAERGGTQDFLAKHEQHGTVRRVRIFSNVLGMSPEMATTLKDAATREYLATERLPIDGIIRALDQPATDLGPAVVYDHHPEAVRLDRFLAERGDELDLLDRLQIVQRIADILRQVHARRITHRMLTPQSIWLRPARTDETPTAGRWVAEITDLSMAAREGATGLTTGSVLTSSRVGRLPSAAAGDIEVVLADPAVESFLAPEAYTDPNADGQALDVFSVGALAYLLLAGIPPAGTREEMRAALGTTGLRLSAVVADADPALDDLVRGSTCPVVTERFPRITDVSAAIDLALESLTAPVTATESESEEKDPLVAVRDDVLGDRFVVIRRLGKGATALALLCHEPDADRDIVLKVSLGAHCDDRIRAEADALEGLRHPAVVEKLDLVELSGKPALVLAFAGDRSVAVELRQDGPAPPEFLQRWGSDLLEAVRYLEREGRSHRDIKPDNLGIVQQGANKERHAVLFDFSLAGVPASDLTAGTPGYLEPFIEERGGWDLWAERYAAAVTLHEMATGELPRWGDGLTNPLYTEGEVQIADDLFDPDLRGPLTTFFSQALRRDYRERFDTAEDMLRSWQRAFESFEAESEPDIAGDDVVGPDATAPGPRVPTRLPANLDLSDPIVSLGGKGRIRSALRRLGAQTVADLASLDPLTVNRTRGVSPPTRRDVLRLRAEVIERFADELAAKATAAAPSEPPPAAAAEPGPEDDAGAAEASPAAEAVPFIARLDLDALALRLLPREDDEALRATR